LRTRTANQHATDSLIKTRTTNTHSTDALIRNRLQQIFHATDAYINDSSIKIKQNGIFVNARTFVKINGSFVAAKSRIM